MRANRYKQEQVLSIVKQMQEGADVQEMARTLGVGRATLYRWRERFGGLVGVEGVDDVGYLRLENQQLKKLVGELTFDNKVLRSALAKKL